MRIIFTDKLSKMVVHYEDSRDMLFELNTSFVINSRRVGEIYSRHCWYQLRPWREKYSVSWTRSTGGKNSERSDISSRNEVQASRYVTLKNNEIAVEEQQQRQTWKT